MKEKKGGRSLPAALVREVWEAAAAAVCRECAHFANMYYYNTKKRQIAARQRAEFKVTDGGGLMTTKKAAPLPTGST